MISVWRTVACGILIEEVDSDVEDSDYSYTTDDLDNDRWGDGFYLGFDEDEGEEDEEQGGEDEEVEVESEMEEA
jgi:hypothetical protein